ncbi:MAG: hypothetical protein O7H40_07690, partial [Gammaproteobacteria bacterium]|nr:hypothetical protein [Gammaproteobacteria bacterium]
MVRNGVGQILREILAGSLFWGLLGVKAGTLFSVLSHKKKMAFPGYPETVTAAFRTRRSAPESCLFRQGVVPIQVAFPAERLSTWDDRQISALIFCHYSKKIINNVSYFNYYMRILHITYEIESSCWRAGTEVWSDPNQSGPKLRALSNVFIRRPCGRCRITVRHSGRRGASAIEINAAQVCLTNDLPRS